MQNPKIKIEKSGFLGLNVLYIGDIPTFGKKISLPYSEDEL
jgi:hypothetical protein